MSNEENVLWVCEICEKTLISNGDEKFNNDSRVVRLDISQSGERMKFDDVDTYEFKDVCLDCRMKISNAIYAVLEEINPEIHDGT